VGILLAFKMFWGVFGSHYSRFSSLRLSRQDLVRYLNSVRKNIKTSFPGYNPAASWGVIGILIVGVLAVISGVVVFSLDEGRGPFRFLYRYFYELAAPLKLLHLGVVYVLLAVIFGHISVVLLEAIRHKTGIVTAMFTGEKFSSAKGIPLTTATHLTILSFAWVLSPFFAVCYLSAAMGAMQPVALAILPIYKKECAACHMAFPPSALPARSWEVMMTNLQGHFGEDASIDESSKMEIEEFLVKNAAEHSPAEASIKLLRSIGKDNSPLRITDIPYWKEKHQSIPQAIYQRGTIKSKANCIACHKWSEYGSFEDGDIRIPRN
jgi:cytochrome b